MANSPQARKRAQQLVIRRERNMAQRSLVRTRIKQVQKAIDSGNRADAQAAFTAAVPVIDRMAGKGKIHLNKAARHKSHLNEQIKAMSSS